MGSTVLQVYEVRPVIGVSHDVVARIVENDGTAYWASSGKATPGGIVWRVAEPFEYNAGGKLRREYSATWPKLAAALVDVMLGRAGVRDEYVEPLRAALDDPDGFADPEAADIVIQYALFGRVVFG